MKSRERLLSFFGAMLIGFGVSAFDLSNPSFQANSKAYIAISGGIVFLIIFYINFRRHKRTKYNGK